MRRLIAFFVLIFIAGTATATPQNMVFILDASGSMWGRVNDTPKIQVAKDVMSELVHDLPTDTHAGLMAYGHRRKGDCQDIETLVELGPLNQDAMVSRIEALNAKGKTPLAASIKKAVSNLRQVESSTRVVLVSDGLESCGGSPCEAVKKAVQSGIDFQLDVVGFDLGNTDTSQLQCMAEAGDGVFYTAANARELSQALAQVTHEPENVEATLQARDGKDGPIMTDGVEWDLRRQDAKEPRVEDRQTAKLELAVAPGEYNAVVRRDADDARTKRTIDVAAEQSEQKFTLVLPASKAKASLDAAETAPAGATVPVGWQGPHYQNDKIGVYPADSSGSGGAINRAVVHEGDNPLELQMPADPGDYELRYIQRQDRKVLATRAITTTPVEASLEAPDTAEAGESIEVDWQGPHYQYDKIGVYPADSSGSGGAINRAVVHEGDNPLELQMPADPGDYELRYIQRQDRKVLATRAIKVD